MEQYQFNPFDNKEASQKEHETMLSNLKSILTRSEGKQFAKYLMKHFAVGEYPAPGIDKDLLLEIMGFSRAGESIFSILAQADPITTGQLMAEIQREKYNVIQN